MDIAPEGASAGHHCGEARYEAVFRQLDVPQWVCDTDGVLLDANDAYSRLVGRTREQLIGCPIDQLSHRSDDGSALAALRRLLAGERDVVQVERVLGRPDGRPVPTLLDAALLRSEDGRPFGAAALVRDLSSLRGLERRRQQQEDFHLALAQRASDLAVVCDARGSLLYTSPGVGGLLGRTQEQVLDAELWSLLHRDDEEIGRQALAEVIGSGGSRTLELRLLHADGSSRWFEVTATNLLDTAVGGVVLNMRDVSERVAAEEALRASEACFRAIADSAEEGIWAATPEGHTLYVNARMAAILGLDPDEVYARTAPDLLDADDAQYMRHRLAGRATAGPERYQITYRHPDGGERVLWISAAPLFDSTGRCEGSLAMVSDVTAARRLERELQHHALHDRLTGLPNRALLLDRLQQSLSVHPSTTAVLFVDLDHFRVLNDSRGHAVGDQLLAAVAERLQSALRPTDTLARLGGDDFAVMCVCQGDDEAQEVAGRLLAILGQPFVIDGAVLHTSASVGIAVAPARSADDLLRNAETAMYAAKSAGRRSIRVFEWTLAADADERYALSADLRVALAEDALALHYQPVVDLTSGRVVGMEALARWQHPTLGNVSPDRFVTVAEATGLAPDLDRWAVRRALREAGALRREGVTPPDAYVAVNISARNLTDRSIETLLSASAQEAGLSPRDIVLEITETTIMNNTDVSARLLQRLRDRGFGVAVDDFGTGHSSMAYLRRLPITLLKIDRFFVDGIGDDTDSRAIVVSIVELSRALGVRVVAEGVETTQHAVALRDIGCDTGQGWLWSPAVSPAAARAGGQLRRRYAVGDVVPRP